MNATATVSGVELWATNLPLIRTPDWYAFYFDRYIEAGSPDTTPLVHGVQMTASNLGLPQSPDWYAWYEERDLQASGGANFALSGEQITGQTSQILAIGAANASFISQSVQSEAQEIDAIGDANRQLSGITGELALAEVSATTVIPVSVTVNLSGITATSSVFSLKANAVNDEVLRLSGNPRRYSMQIQNANLNLQGIAAKMSTSGMSASGTTVISNVVRLNVISAPMVAENLTADGILDISEEELTIFLMAA
jgi:hypothetical protein